MDYKELLEKYNLLLDENSRLIQENNRLKSQLGITICSSAGYRFAGSNEEENCLDDEPNRNASFSGVHNGSDSSSKIRLFMSLFKGRTDVYAKKWQNKKKATSGRPPEGLRDKDRIALQQALEVLKGHNITVIFKPRIHQKFAIIDQKTVWYGSINLLSYGNAQESIVRIESFNIANELIKSIENP